MHERDGVVFFEEPAEWRAWLEANHATASEVVVGFYRKGSGKRSITWPEAVDEALCFGWIDGVRRKIDDESYSNRVTPRKARSNWSAINIARVAELTTQGRMTAAGLAAFEKRIETKSSVYSYENRPADLPGEYAAIFEANGSAWANWMATAPGQRRTLIWWVVSAKQEATRLRRLESLMAEAEKGPIRVSQQMPGAKAKQ